MKSRLEQERVFYCPKSPPSFEYLTQLVPETLEELPIDSKIAPLFPLSKERNVVGFKKSDQALTHPFTIGIVFSGGPASGGHNVASGVFDALQRFHPEGQLIGFLGGPSGIIDNRFIYLETQEIDEVRNQGGFSLLGTGRTKIETDEQFLACKTTCEAHELDGLIIVGGDDSNTNAALLAEYFLQVGCKTAVIGVPKTIDGDLKNQWIEISFGFDSASKTYSEIIGNLARDAISQGKYYFFVKIMGRTASHLLLECALQTCPNLALIGEEVSAKKMTLRMIVQEIVDLIVDRSANGKNHGVVLVPEGLIEFIPDFKKMITELTGKKEPTGLSQEAKNLFDSLPESIQKQFFLEMDPHGNIQVSKIETERLLIALVDQELQKRNVTWSAQPVFMGYEGRSCLPSNFDCDYCYSLGRLATLLIAHKKTGMMAVIHHLNQSAESWTCYGVPLVCLLKMKLKKGKERPVIEQNLVDIDGLLFQRFAAERESWRVEDYYKNPGPIQFFGHNQATGRITETLKES